MATDGQVLYEYPFSERIRTLLRLEDLFDKLLYFCEQQHSYCHHTALLTLFEIIFRVLNEVRSVVLCSHLWAAVQTNYLGLQSFETPAPARDLYMLAQFDENTGPAVGSMHFVRGLAEGFPPLYSFIEDLRCVEEVSQLRIEDIVREFAGYRVSLRNDQIAIHAPAGPDPVVEARRVALKSEAAKTMARAQSAR